MQQTDTYLTVLSPTKETHTVQRSKFIAMAFPVSSIEEIRSTLADVRKNFFDARHVCYAYILGADRATYRSNDDGEPSGTAGKPILGQLNSRSLSNSLVIVVRYFGGIKLGTSGLLAAYRTAAAACLDAATIVEKVETENINISFEYSRMDTVMRTIRALDATIVEQGGTGTLATLTVAVRRSAIEQVQSLNNM